MSGRACRCRRARGGRGGRPCSQATATDATTGLSNAFRAACTPDLFLFDAGARLAYRGQFDDSRPSLTRPVTGSSLRAAITAVAAGKAGAPDQRPSVGCNIKWKPGNAPPYFG